MIKKGRLNVQTAFSIILCLKMNIAPNRYRFSFE